MALLRGINVGGSARVPMAELRELCEGVGLTDVATYVQSGNVVFTAASLDAAISFSSAPSKERAAALDSDRSPGDRFALRGRELYVHYPNGQGRSKLTVDYIEKALGTVGTARNWNTVQKLRAMVTEVDR